MGESPWPPSLATWLWSLRHMAGEDWLLEAILWPPHPHTLKKISFLLYLFSSCENAEDNFGESVFSFQHVDPGCGAWIQVVRFGSRAFPTSWSHPIRGHYASQNMSFFFLMSLNKINWIWWCMPIHQSTWEAEARSVSGRMKLKVSLDYMRSCLKNK